MKAVLDVPFVPEQRYIEFLNACGERIDSIQFSLAREQGMDNRFSRRGEIPFEELVSLLAGVTAPRKYALLNSRFYGPELLTDRDRTRQLVAMLDRCAEQGGGTLRHCLL